MIYVPWIVILCLLFLIAEASKSWILGCVFYVLVVLVVLSIKATRRPPRLLAVQRRLSATSTEIGCMVHVDVTMTWDHPIPLGWLMVHDTIPESFHAHQAYGQLLVAGTESSTTFRYQISGEKRGYFPVGPLQFSSGDLFGLAQRRSQNDTQEYITVYPRVAPVGPICIPSNRPLGDARSEKPIFEDSTRTIGLRDYLPGDPLSRVHWKTTARTGYLVSKICEASTSVEINILLNLCADDYPRGEKDVDLACTTAASIASSQILDRHYVGLQSNGFDAAWRQSETPSESSLQIKSDRGENQLAEILGALGRLELSSTLSLQDYLTQVHSTLPWTSTTLVITHRLTEGSVVALDALKRTGFELAVVIVGSGQDAETAMVRAASISIPVAVVQSEKSLAYLEFWRP